MANLDPEDTPFLLSEEGGKGIDWKMLREKFTGRSGLFFNNTNFGGRRGSRKSNGWDIPELVIDPSVKYRAFGGSEFAADILNNNRISGGYNVGTGVPAGVFFNQGVPLWSYASTPNERYLVATLGENWGDRRGNAPESRPALPDDWRQGGTELKERLGDFAPGAIEETSIKLPSHNLTDAEKGSIVAFSRDVDAVRKKYNNLDQAVRNLHSGNAEELSMWDLEEIEKHVKKTNPKLYIQKQLEVSDLQRQVDELDEKIEKSLADKNPDKNPIDASYERSDWRRDKSKILEEIRDAKLTSYVAAIKDTLPFERTKEIRALLNPENIRLLLEHAKWVDAVYAFKKAKLSSVDTPGTVKSLLNGNIQNRNNALGSYDVSEYALNQIFSPIGYIKADSGLVGGSYEKALKILFDEVTHPEKAWSENAKTNPNGLAHHLLHYIPELLDGFQVRGKSLGNFGDYTVSDRPDYLPTFSKPPSGASPESSGEKSIEKEGFFESPLGRYLLGPKGSQIFIGARDNPAFATQELAWKSKEGFGLEPINSDGNRIMASQLQWPLIGKEGAMYSETLPISTWTAPWDSKTKIQKNKWSFHPGFSDKDLELHLSTIQTLAGKYPDTAERLRKYGEFYRTQYQVGGWSPEDGDTAVRLPNGDIVRRIYDARSTITNYRDSSDPGLVELLDTLPEDKLDASFWVKLDNVDTSNKPNPRIFQFNAGEIDLAASARPTVLFRVDSNAPGGFVVVKEWNNDANKSGIKPIPTEQQTPEMRRNALIRFAQETIDPISKITLESIKQKYIDEDTFGYLHKDDVGPRIDAEARSELSQLQSKFPWLSEYKGPEHWADSVMEGTNYDLTGLLYRGSSTTRTPSADLSSATTKGYTTIQNLIDESTRGNPNYGKLGSNFGPQLEAIYDTGVKLDQGINRYTRDFTRSYVNNPNFRSSINSAALGAAERYGPAAVMAAFAGMGIRDKVDNGVPLWKAIPAQGVEMGAGYYAFKYFDRYLGGVTMLGDATIEGHKRRMAEEDAIRAERQSEIARSVVGHMTNPIEKQKVDWKEVGKQEKALESQKRKDAHDAWLKENNIFAGDVI